MTLLLKQSAGLIEVNSDGNAMMKVDTTSTITGNRKSVRITTENTFTGVPEPLSNPLCNVKLHKGGIFMLDAVHMPQGCATWP